MKYSCIVLALVSSVAHAGSLLEEKSDTQWNTAAFGDRQKIVGKFSLAAPSADENDDLTRTSSKLFMSYAGDNSALHFTNTQGTTFGKQGLGFTLGNTTIGVLNGFGNAYSSADRKELTLGSNFFHGEPFREYGYTGYSLSHTFTPGVDLFAGQTNIYSDGVDSRDVSHFGFSTDRISGTYYTVDSGGDNAGEGLDLRLRFSNAELGYQNLESTNDARIQRYAISFAGNKADSIGFSYEQGDNPLYTDAEEKRYMVTYRKPFGRKTRDYSPGTELTYVEQANAAFRQSASRGGDAVLAATRVSSGQNDRVKRYPGPHWTAYQALSQINPRSVRENVEFGGAVYRNGDGTYSHTGYVRGTIDSVAFNPYAITPEGKRTVAAFHTHGAYDPRYDNEHFSPADIRFQNYYQLDGYLATPAGRWWWYDYETDQIFLNTKHRVPN